MAPTPSPIVNYGSFCSNSAIVGCESIECGAQGSEACCKCHLGGRIQLDDLSALLNVTDDIIFRNQWMIGFWFTIEDDQNKMLFTLQPSKMEDWIREIRML